MPYYSICAFSKVSVQYKEPNVIFIEPGINVFTVLTDDISTFKNQLKSDGIRIDALNRLDGSEAHTGK